MRIRHPPRSCEPGRPETLFSLVSRAQRLVWDTNHQQLASGESGSAEIRRQETMARMTIDAGKCRELAWAHRPRTLARMTIYAEKCRGQVGLYNTIDFLINILTILFT